MIEEKTIAAIATPPGYGGVAIIRLSGSQAVEVANTLFSKDVKKMPSHTVRYGTISHMGTRIDEALVVVMRAPRSFTGEDVVEIQCHGGPLVAKKVLQAALQSGAEPAPAGGFSYRAYMNGKLDLSQAEAISQLIHAKSEEGMRQAHLQLEGALSIKIRSFQEKLVKLAAIFEAWVDFPEEGLEFATPDEMLTALDEILREMRLLLATFEEGKKMTDGVTLCLMGSPNVGKSSLMNALLRKERAIVTPIAGTTRDLIEEDMIIGGVAFHLTDTAGLRTTDEVIEKEGIARSYQAAERADLILYVCDITTPPEDLASVDPEKTILIWNKADLPHAPPSDLFPHAVTLSAKTEEGIEALKALLLEMALNRETLSKSEVCLTNQRHQRALHHSIDALQATRQGLEEGHSPELITSDMKESLHYLSEIIGQNVGEEILSSIFSNFCIGK